KAVPPDFVSNLSRTTPFALALIRELAAFLGCEPKLESVQRSRHEKIAADGGAYLRSLMTSAGITGLVVDDGYPQPRIDPAVLRQEYSVAIGSVARIEPLILTALETATSWRSLNREFVAKLDAAIAAGAIAIKSIIAYRSGLDIAWPPGEDLEQHFARWRQDGFPRGRGSAKIIRDALAYAAADVAKVRDVPFH